MLSTHLGLTLLYSLRVCCEGERGRAQVQGSLGLELKCASSVLPAVPPTGLVTLPGTLLVWPRSQSSGESPHPAPSENTLDSTGSSVQGGTVLWCFFLSLAYKQYRLNTGPGGSAEA